MNPGHRATNPADLATPGPNPTLNAAPPFRATDEAVRDLRARLRSARWPEPLRHLTPQHPSVPGTPTHELWHRLMLSLGYHRYAAHGGDLGAGVTTRLAEA